MKPMASLPFFMCNTSESSRRFPQCRHGESGSRASPCNRLVIRSPMLLTVVSNQLVRTGMQKDLLPGSDPASFFHTVDQGLIQRLFRRQDSLARTRAAPSEPLDHEELRSILS